jgi:hypothetical protein
MRFRSVILTGLVAVTLGVGSVRAHDNCWPCHHHHGCRSAGAVAPGVAGFYDPDTDTTVRGSVVGVSVVPARGGRGGGMHLQMETEGGTLDVHLGPTWFLEGQGFAFTRGDTVEVTGSLVDLDGTTALVARELGKGGKVLRLRDQQGAPTWAGPAGRR